MCDRECNCKKPGKTQYSPRAILLAATLREKAIANLEKSRKDGNQ